MKTKMEIAFHEEIASATEQVRRLGVYPARNYQMLGEPGGGPEMARRLLSGPNASDGFTFLYNKGRLDLSVEAAVLLPWYEPLFTAEQRAVAQRRLLDHRFDIAAFLTRRTAKPPDWTTSIEDRRGGRNGVM
jgi:hypothetical protein